MNAKKKTSTIPDEKLLLYDKLLSQYPEVEKRGVTMPYTALNGNMFSFLNPEGELALRLPATERDDFVKKFRTRLFEAHGTVLKEYVHVPADLFQKTKDLKKYFEKSLEYAGKLKSKKK